MKRKREFLESLYKNRIDKLPFLEYFQSDKYLRNELFGQYLNTELKPDFNLYLSQYFTDKEIENEVDYEKRFAERQNEFYGLSFKDKLPLEFFSHSIDKTLIYKGLFPLDNKIEEFRKRVLNPKDYNSSKYAKSFAKSIINDLEKIGIMELSIKILRAFTNSIDNHEIISALYVTGGDNFEEKYGITYNLAFSNYSELKSYADDYIIEYLKKVEETILERNTKKSFQNTITETNKENDFILSTIEDYLEPIKDKFTETSYILLVKELNNYFTNGSFTKSKETISTTGRFNMKVIGWQLNEIYRALKQDNLSLDYIKFGKERISVFNGVNFDETNYLKSTLYKYYTTKTPIK